MASSEKRKCKNSSDVFCNICGCYTLYRQQNKVTDFVKKADLTYFGIKLGDEDKAWAHHIVYKTCVATLREWEKGQRNHLTFGIPMVCREPENHHDDNYF